LLIGNTIGYGSSIAVDLTVGSISIFEQLEMILIVLVYAALALSAKSFSPEDPPENWLGWAAA